MYRWIKKGSKGIALIDNTSGPKTKLRYVFDVQDTYKVRNLGKDPQLWNLPVEGEQLVADYLQEQLSLEDTEGGLAESLHQAAKESMQEWLPDALEELRLDVTGTFLEELDEQNQEVEFRELMTNSVWYVLLNRCGLDVQEYLDAEDFRHITDFNQLKVLGHLGSAVNEISRPVLMQIGRYVLKDLENDLKTVAKEKEVAYNEFNTLIRESNTDNTEDKEEKKEETHRQYGQIAFTHFTNQHFRPFFLQSRYERFVYHDRAGGDNLGTVYIFYETLHISIGGFGQYLFRSACLYDFAVFHNGDAVTQLDGLIQVVGDKDNCLFHFRL